MAETLNNPKETYQEFNNQVDEINSLIKEFVNITEVINEYESDRYNWESHFSTLSINIWAGQMKYFQLQEKEAHYKTAIFESIKTTDFKEKKLRNLLARRISEFSELGAYFRNKNKYYTNNFLRAQMEYSVETLTKEIEQNREEYKKELQKLPILKKRLVMLQKECGSDCTNAKADVEEVLKMNIMLDTIMTKNKDQSQQNKLLLCSLTRVENEIKRTRIELFS